jgi:hypothetical protein
MQDLALFQLARPPRRPDLTADQQLVLAGPLLDQLAELLSRVDDFESPDVQDVLRSFESSQVNPLDYALGTAQSDGTAVQDMATLMGRFEAWLAIHHDNPSWAALSAELRRLQADYQNADTSWRQALADFEKLVASWIAIWTANNDTDQLATGTRFALAAGLVALDAALLDDEASSGQSPGQTWDRLNRRVVIFPAPLGKFFTRARVTLVRRATVADLQVVRSEWRGYVPGEIAMVRNVMAGESLEQLDKQVNQTDTTQTFDTQTMTEKQTDAQQTDESDLSRQVNTQLGVSVQGYLNTNYRQSTPGYNLSVSAGVSGGVQIGRSESLATRISREAVSRAVATVQTTTREIRSQRTLIRTEETLDHKFEGTGSNRRGVYRWVDEIDRYQVFTYPNRLQLEFELPEPAEYIRWRLSGLQQAASDPPPAWDPDYLATMIDPDNPASVLQAAAHYRASNLPVLPDASVSVVTSLTAEPENLPQNFNDSIWNAPTIVKDIELAVPDGYVATAVDFSGHATPLRGMWHREYTQHSGADDQDSFHSIVASVAIGADTTTTTQFGPGTGNENTIMAPLNPEPQFAQALLAIAPTNVALQTPATAKVTVGVRAVGAGTVTVAFDVTCERSSQALAQWKQGVYDALFAAWNDWNRTFQAAQQDQALTGSVPVGEGSPEQNLVTVQGEIKRQVVEWLLNESPFQGRPGLLGPAGPPPTPPTPWRDIDITKALASAPDIQFLEQAFDWANMSYIFYPYYWADRASWDVINSVTADDPAYLSFLQAGSARVVVPALPGMEAAVQYWLLYQKPFLGRPMPVPGDPLYVSIATEVRDLMVPPADGIPGESWEAELGTTYLWLDDSGAPLPTNPLASLGAPPNEPKPVLYPPKALT